MVDQFRSRAGFVREQYQQHLAAEIDPEHSFVRDPSQKQIAVAIASAPSSPSSKLVRHFLLQSICTVHVFGYYVALWIALLRVLLVIQTLRRLYETLIFSAIAWRSTVSAIDLLATQVADEWLMYTPIIFLPGFGKATAMGTLITTLYAYNLCIKILSYFANGIIYSTSDQQL